MAIWAASDFTGGAIGTNVTIANEPVFYERDGANLTYRADFLGSGQSVETTSSGHLALQLDGRNDVRIRGYVTRVSGDQTAGAYLVAFRVGGVTVADVFLRNQNGGQISLRENFVYYGQSTTTVVNGDTWRYEARIRPGQQIDLYLWLPSNLDGVTPDYSFSAPTAQMIDTITVGQAGGATGLTLQLSHFAASDGEAIGPYVAPASTSGLAWWDGSVERPVSIDGWWNGAKVIPVAVSRHKGVGGVNDGNLPYWGMPVWRDEFDYRDEAGQPALDPAKWNTRNNFTTIDTARAMKANAITQGDVLTLRGSWLPTPESDGPQGVITHTTGYVDTRNLVDAANPTPVHQSQMYGRWEIRCQTPTGPNTRGALAAFWLRCDSNLGEIDIMEAWGGGGTMSPTWNTYTKDSATSTFHSSTTSSTINGKPYRKTFWRHWQHGGPRPMWDDMHTIGYERTPEYQSIDVDGVQLVRFTPDDVDPVNGGTLAWLWDPDFFGSPLHMRINLHIGPSATYWGLPDPDNRQWTVDPLDFRIAHVRVWAMP